MDIYTANAVLWRKIKWAYLSLLILVIWFSLVLQFSISIAAYREAGRSIAGSLLILFSFFTILTNILAVKSATIILIAPNSYWGRFFSKSQVQCAITVYIVIVGLVYNLVLRQQWSPKGWFKLADELLHLVNPVLFVVYWLVFALKSDLKYKYLPAWLLYPVIYFIYILIRGAVKGDYPYPFMNVTLHGYITVTLNCIIVLLAFAGIGALFIWIGRLIYSRQKLSTDKQLHEMKL